MSVRGWVQGCAWQPRGSELTADAAAGATVLHVEDLTDFDDDPGMLSLNDQLYTYSAGAVDEDAGTITLDVGIVADATVGDRVYAVSRGQTQRDVILFVSCGDGDAVEVTADFTQRDLWPEGDYDDPVQVILSDDLERVEDVPGRLPKRMVIKDDGETSDLDDTLEQLNQDLTELNDVTLPQVQADLAQATTDLTGIQALFPITSTSISDSAITTPKIAANAITGDKIVANSITGTKIVGLTITGDKIAANTISGDKIIANSIGADQIAANSITAGKIATGALTGMDASLNDVMVHQLTTIGGGVNSQGEIHGAAGVFDDELAGGGVTPAKVNANGRFIRDTSAAKHKENVRPIDVDLDAVAAVDPVLYEWIDKDLRGHQTEPGATADQALEAGAGRFVIFDQSGDVAGFRYDRFGAVGAILAARELQQVRAENADLRSLVETLAARIDALEAK